jgi:hypothetical protein
MARVLALLALLALMGTMTTTMTEAFSFSYFGANKGSSASGGAGVGAGGTPRHMVVQRPLPGTDAFAKVRGAGGEWRRVGCCVPAAVYAALAACVSSIHRSQFAVESIDTRIHTYTHHHRLQQPQRTAGLVVPPSAARRPTDGEGSSSSSKSSKGTSVYNPMHFLARFALALAPSALMGAGLVPLVVEPRAVVAAQADDSFKVRARVWFVAASVIVIQAWR